MRTFEERKEEIIRRSEARIRKRNSLTRRIAALCIPLVLTVGVLVLRPTPTPAGPETVTTPNFTPSPEQAMGSDRTVTVSKNGQLVIHEDDTAVTAIITTLDTICSRLPKPVVDNFEDMTITSRTPWRITLLEEGRSVVYILDGNELRLNGKTWLLSESERNTLYPLLGLPSA